MSQTVKLIIRLPSENSKRFRVFSKALRFILFHGGQRKAESRAVIEAAFEFDLGFELDG